MTTTATGPPVAAPSAPSSVRRRVWLAVVVAVLGLVVAGLVWIRHQHAVDRERVWRRGGDDVKVAATVRIASGVQPIKNAIKRAGGNPHGAPVAFGQGIIVSLTWSGPAQKAGSTYEFMLLDRRTSPPTPLAVVGGTNWASNYDVLADHYSWLRGIAITEKRNAYGGPGLFGGLIARDASPLRHGHRVFAFALLRGQPRLIDPSKDLMIAMFLTEDTNDGDVPRWATQVPIATAR